LQSNTDWWSDGDLGGVTGHVGLKVTGGDVHVEACPGRTGHLTRLPEHAHVELGAVRVGEVDLARFTHRVRCHRHRHRLLFLGVYTSSRVLVPAGVLRALLKAGDAVVTDVVAALGVGVGDEGDRDGWALASTLLLVAVDGLVLEGVTLTAEAPEGRWGVVADPGAPLSLAARPAQSAALVVVCPRRVVAPPAINGTRLGVASLLPYLSGLPLTVVAAILRAGGAASPGQGHVLASAAARRRA